MNKLFILMSIVCITLVASGCVDDLNQIESKQEDTYLKVGDVGIIDDLKIEIIDVQLKNSMYQDGSAILSIEIRVENIGKFATGDVLDHSSSPSLYYYDRKMENSVSEFVQLPRWDGFSDKYPGTIEEGWMEFKVPSAIELNQTTFNTLGLKWKIG